MTDARRRDLMRQHRGIAVGAGVAFLAVLWLTCAPAPQLFTMPVTLGEHRAGRPLPQMNRVPREHQEQPIRLPAEAFWTSMAVIGAVLTVYIAYLIVKSLSAVPHLSRHFLWHPWGRRRRKAATHLEVLPEPPAALLDGGDEFHALLRAGEVSDAIVACWVRLEEAAAEAGVDLYDYETSTEYTARVVGLWVNDDRPLLTLAELYREARFSRHDLPESKRDEAHAALAALLAGLRATWKENHASA